MECFSIPQDAPSEKSPWDYAVDLDDIEDQTTLKFFEGWSRELDPMAGVSFGVEAGKGGNRDRLREAYERLDREA